MLEQFSRSLYTTTDLFLSDAAVLILTERIDQFFTAGWLFFINIFRQILVVSSANEAQTAAGSVLIYRFVCHPTIAYVSPIIVYVTSVLIPAKPEEDAGDV